MIDTNTPNKSSWRFLTRLGWAWVIIILVMLVSSFGLGWFDDTTELTPSHDDVLELCFIAAGLMGVISAVLIWSQARGVSLGRHIGMAISIAFMAFLATFLLGSSLADLIEGAIDFPSARTKTYPALLAISRAYQTHERHGTHWNIQTMPMWSNIDITEEDYGFMLRHRKPGDGSSGPDNISSQGYFCIKAMVEQSGSALRIMHAGREKLPNESVILCPPDAKPLGY